MREYVLAMRAIWATWNEGETLNFRGEFYRLTLMSPFFNPGPNPFGTPKIFIAGVGELMTEVAGEVADGFLVHPLMSAEYLKKVTLPAIDRGLAKAGRARSSFQISFAGLVAAGLSEQKRSSAIDSVRAQIAFYGSTPAYKNILEIHGWEDLHVELNKLSKAGAWKDMGALIDDDVLNTFSIVEDVDHIAPTVHQRFGHLIDRFSLSLPYDLDESCRSEIYRGLKSLPSDSSGLK